MTPVYAASTTLLINQTPVSSAAPDYNSLLVSQRLAQTYGELLRKRPALQAVITNLKLNTDTEHLAERVKIAVARDTQFIDLTVEDTNPQLAADIANEIARVFSQQNRELQLSQYISTKQNLQKELENTQADIEDTQAKLDSMGNPTKPAQLNEQRQLQTLLDQHRASYETLLKNFGEVRLAEAQSAADLSVVEAAQPETRPIRPRTLLNTLLAAILGSLLALGLALLVEYLDDTVKSRDDIQELLQTPLLAAIVRVKKAQLVNNLVTLVDTRSPIAEAYRMLRTNIEFSAITRPMQTIVVTSSGPFEGKSTTAANLAVVFAQAGKRVILIDTDLRRPTLHTFFLQTNERGLTTALLQLATSATSEQQSIYPVHERSPLSTPRPEEPGAGYLFPTSVDNLSLMPSGPLPPNPADLLGSHWMSTLIERLKAQADLVIFDSPPVLSVVDAALLACSCDATLLIARAGHTRADSLKQARDQLLQSSANLLGAVLNGVSPRNEHYNHYYYPKRGKSYNGSSPWRRRVRLPFFHRRTAPTTPVPSAATTSSNAAPVAVAVRREAQPSEQRKAEVPLRTPPPPVARKLRGKVSRRNGDIS
jgi:non-specific protein-tyrosine kinase